MEDDSDEDFFLSAQRSAGVVTYGVVTKLPGKSSGVSGESLFELLVDWFGRANIRVIRSRWNVAAPGESVNLERFNRLTTPEVT